MIHLAAAAAGGFATPHIRYLAILPEIVMLGGAVMLLAVASLVRRSLRVGVATAATVAVSLGALGCSLWQWSDVTGQGAFTAVDHAVVVDGFSALVNVLVACAMALTALVGDGYLRREGADGPELHVLAMVSASGAMVMASANDLIVVFLGLEILSIALYVLAAFNHRRAASGEAALKYFILGSFSSAVFVYGIALVYGATGSTNLAQIAGFLSKTVLSSDGLLLAGMAMLIVGFAFKVAAVPFHMWTPDVYQGSPSPITGFMAAVAKAGAFAAFLRVLISSFGLLRTDWQPVVYALAIVTLLVGAGLAVVQRDVKRMLAYSSINHAGFVLLGLEAATTRGVSASLYYLFAYTFMVIGSFAVVTVVGRRGDAAHDISSYRGLARRQPLLAIMFAVLLLAQAGAPFTTGLWAKLQVVLAAAHGAVPLAVVAMVSAAIAAFFYLRVAVLMYSPLATAGETPGVQSPAAEPQALFSAGAPGGEGTPAAATAGSAVGATATAGSAVGATTTAGSALDSAGAASGDGATSRTLWTGLERSMAGIARINAALLLDEEPGRERMVGDAPPSPAGTGPSGETGVDAVDATGAVSAGPAPVPLLTAIAVGLCVGVTVVFGIWPAPLTSFAHQATLLFFP